MNIFRSTFRLFLVLGAPLSIAVASNSLLAQTEDTALTIYSINKNRGEILVYGAHYLSSSSSSTNRFSLCHKDISDTELSLTKLLNTNSTVCRLSHSLLENSQITITGSTPNQEYCPITCILRNPLDEQDAKQVEIQRGNLSQSSKQITQFIQE